MFWSGLITVAMSSLCLAVTIGPWPISLVYAGLAILAYVLGVLRGMRMSGEKEE